MKHKKLLAVLLGLMLVFAFSACGSSENKSGNDDSSQKTATEDDKTKDNETSSDAPDSSAENPGKTATKDNKAFGPLAEKVKAVWDKKYEYGDLIVGTVGDTLKNEFFDWIVNSVDTKTKLHGKSAGKGYKYVVVNVTIENTTDYDFDTGNFEFRGIVGTSEEEDLDSANSFYDDMIPDEFEIKAGKSVTGDLVFKVKTDINEILVDYEEFYENDVVGNTYWFDLKL